MERISSKVLAAPALDGCQVQPHVLLGRRAWLKQLQEESQAEKTRPLRRLWAEDFRQKLRSCRTHAVHVLQHLGVELAEELEAALFLQLGDSWVADCVKEDAEETMHVRRCRGLLFWASRFSLAELAQKGRAAAAAELLVGFPKPPPQPWEERESTEHEDAIEDFDEEAASVKPAKAKRKSQAPRKPRVEGAAKRTKAPKASKAPTVSPLWMQLGHPGHTEGQSHEPSVPHAAEEPPIQSPVPPVPQNSEGGAQDVLWSRLGFSPFKAPAGPVGPAHESAEAPEPNALPFPALGARKRRMEEPKVALATPPVPDAKEPCGRRKEQALAEIRRILEVPETNASWAHEVLRLEEGLTSGASKALRLLAREVHPDGRPPLADEDELRSHEALAKLQRARRQVLRAVKPPRRPERLRSEVKEGGWHVTWHRPSYESQAIWRYELRAQEHGGHGGLVLKELDVAAPGGFQLHLQQLPERLQRLLRGHGWLSIRVAAVGPGGASLSDDATLWLQELTEATPKGRTHLAQLF